VIVSAHNGYPNWLNSGADFMEVDIRRTPGEVIVLAHDVLQPNRKYVELDEVLEAACGKIGLQLDLKEPGYEDLLLTKVLSRCAPDRVVVTTDRSEALRHIKHVHPDVKAGLTRRHVEETDFDFLCLDQAYVNDDELDFCLQRDIPVWVWTVDNPRQMRRFFADGRIAGLITNRPDRALQLRSDRS
jgi:glycerophosphoryl diester phosphodiesterase